MSQSHPITPMHRGYEQNCNASLISPNAGKQLKVFDIRLLNRSGLISDIGFMKKLAASALQFFSLIGGVATDISAAIAKGTATGIFTVTGGDGFMVQSPKIFNMVGVTMSTAQTGSPVITINYWNGSAFTAVPNVIVVPNYTATGYVYLLFNAPRDWVPGGNISGLNSTKYTIEVTAASSTVGQANAIQVASLLDFSSNIPSDNGFERSYSIDYPLYLDANEGIIPYFSSASAKNMVTIAYSQED